MDENCSVKIDINQGVLEFEGSESFVKEQMANLTNIIEIISQVDYRKESVNELDYLVEENAEKENKELDKVKTEELEVPESFGEWLHKFKPDISENDLALVSAYYIQKNNEDNEFNSLEVTKNLKEHGHKLSNTSGSIKRLTTKKFVFQVRKEGKLKYMRVSASGIEHLKTILNKTA